MEQKGTERELGGRKEDSAIEGAMRELGGGRMEL